MATINLKQPGDCGFIAFFNGQRAEFYAKSQFAALEQARKYFRPTKSKMHMVSVHLAERADGSDVVHTAVD